MSEIGDDRYKEKSDKLELRDWIVVFFIVLAIIANYWGIQVKNLIPIDYLIYPVGIIVLVFIKGRTISLKNKTTLLFLLFVILINSSVYWSGYKLETLAYSSRFIFLFCFYILILNVKNIDAIERILKSIIGITLIVSIISIYNIIINPHLYYGRFLFFTSYRGDPNFTAYSLVLCIIMCSYFYYEDRKKAFKYILIVMFFLMLLLLTISRGIIISFLITFILMFWRTIKGRSKEKSLQLIIITLGLFLIGFIIILWLYNMHNDFLMHNLRFKDLKSGSGRIDLWENAINLILEKPLMGHGAGTFRYLAPAIKISESFYKTQVTHNSFLEIAVGGGLSLLLLLLMIIWRAIKSTNGNIKNKRLNFYIMWFLIFSFISMLTINLETHRLLWLSIGISQVLKKEEL